MNTKDTDELREQVQHTIYSDLSLLGIGQDPQAEKCVDNILKLFTTHQQQAIERAMEKFGVKKGVEYDVKATDKVIVITPHLTQENKEDK